MKESSLCGCSFFLCEVPQKVVALRDSPPSTVQGQDDEQQQQIPFGDDKQEMQVGEQ